MQKNLLVSSLANWFMRRTNSSAIRRIGELSIAIGSDIGVVRNENQDRVAIVRGNGISGQSYLVGVICDGMGGMADGAQCASTAMATFLTSCYQNSHVPPKERLLQAVVKSNEAIYEQYRGSGGSTISAFLVDDDEVFWGVNVGDSRIYSLTKNLNQLTVDDTFAGQREEGSPADEYFRSNELLQFVGMGEDLQPHLIEIGKVSDNFCRFFLLTSDGVHFLPKEVIQSVLTHAAEPALAVRRLIELSKWCGGKDNATVIALSSDKLFTHEKRSNVIEIWDAFGELQILLEPSLVNDSLHEANKEKSISEASQNRAESETLRTASKKARRSISKSTSPRNKRAKQKSLELDDVSPSAENNQNELPKLIIEFKN